MTELVTLLHDWRWFCLALLAFGVAPGAVLRILVLAYPKHHNRRSELIAELYALGYLERPWFVAQQLETAVSEGLPARWHARTKHEVPEQPTSEEIEAQAQPSTLGQGVSPIVREAQRRARRMHAESARSIGLDRRRFLLETKGSARTLVALAACSADSSDNGRGSH